MVHGLEPGIIPVTGRRAFEWDASKDRDNQNKHGVSFSVARRAFFDAQRVIARDTRHSVLEPRFFCFGRVGDGILTVRFTYRSKLIRIIGAGYWRKGKALYEATNSLHRRTDRQPPRRA